MNDEVSSIVHNNMDEFYESAPTDEEISSFEVIYEPMTSLINR